MQRTAMTVVKKAEGFGTTTFAGGRNRREGNFNDGSNERQSAGRTGFSQKVSVGKGLRRRLLRLLGYAEQH
jgi:hypothetical protein